MKEDLQETTTKENENYRTAKKINKLLSSLMMSVSDKIDQK